MSRAFHCGHCKGLLNPGSEVVLVIEFGSGRGLVLLSPELGDYTAVLAQSIPLEVGRAYVFRCPLCDADLSSRVDRALVELLARSSGGAEATVRPPSDTGWNSPATTTT